MEGIEAMVDGLCRYIGQTVTVFTTSGGLSGEGFTGVLLSADCRAVRLLSDFGAPPACAIGSACSNNFGWGGNGGGCNNFRGNPFGRANRHYSRHMRIPVSTHGGSVAMSLTGMHR